MENLIDPKLDLFCKQLKTFYKQKNIDEIINKVVQISNYENSIFEQFKNNIPVIRNYCNLENTHGNLIQYDLGNSKIKMLSKNHVDKMDKNIPPMVRIHSSCCNSEVFKAIDCDCALQLDAAIKLIHRHDDGIIFHLDQEGRGHGYNKKIAIVKTMQSKKLNTYQSCQHLDLEKDIRDYETVAVLLKKFGFQSVRIISNNPTKQKALKNMALKLLKNQ